jgi:hypothetical protein
MRVQQPGSQARTPHNAPPLIGPVQPRHLEAAILLPLPHAARLQLLLGALLVAEPLDCSCDGTVRHRQLATPLHLDAPAIVPASSLPDSLVHLAR